MTAAVQTITQNETAPVGAKIINLLESTDYLSYDGKICVPLGKTDQGQIIVRDLNDIPHILVSGMTGTGKTAFVETILAVICTNKSPDDVRFVVYDSKGVDYIHFQNDHHLLLPIITDREQAVSTLRYLAKESQDRFVDFAKAACKDLDGYNNKVEKDKQKPIIVLVLDDYSTLHLTRDELYSFQTILKNGRIAGIHAIVVSSVSASSALQKEVISYIPCHIAFRMSSKAESRAVLESGGAESLLIPGEMIYKYQGDFLKCQCAYATFENIRDSLLAANKPKKSLAALGKIAAHLFDGITPKSADKKPSPMIDDMLKDAGLSVIASGRATIGGLQRTFKISFNRAAHILDDLEQYGVVSAQDNTGARRILMTKKKWEDLCGKNETGTDRPAEVIRSEGKSIPEKENVVQGEPETTVKMRDFAEYEVDGVTLSISDNEIHYNKPIQTRLGLGHMTPSFNGRSIKRIIYKKPSLFSKGYFTFEFKDGVNIVNSTPHLVQIDLSNVSELIKVHFGTETNKTIQLFLQQISEDVGIPITRV